VAATDYHTYEQLQSLGQQVRDKAVAVSVEQESAQVVQQIQAEHANDPLLDATGHVAPDPAITQQMIKSHAESMYQDIPAMFTAFATADPARMQPMIDSLWGVAYALDTKILGSVAHTPLDDPIPAGAWHPGTSIQDRVQDIIDPRMKYWAGPAANTFETNYLRPLAATVTPQSEVAAALAVSLTAQKNLREHTHANIWQIGQETITVLDTLHHTHPHDARVVLDAFTAAIAVILAVPTDGWSFAGAFGLVGAIQGLTDSAANVTKIIGGKTVAAVISSMADAVSSLASGVDQQEQAITGFLDKVSSQITPADITAPQPTSVTSLAHANADTLKTQFHPTG
jgi:hypothetical protein